MKVIGREKLIEFSAQHANAKNSIDAWLDEAERANWKKPQDIKNRYRSADILSDNRVIFNIKGNHYRLLVKMLYQNGIAAVLWVGTHAEYDKQKF